MLPASAPLRLRALRIEGRRSVEQIVDAYGIECRAVRDLLVEHFTERAPELDHVSLRSIARDLCRLFWRDLESQDVGELGADEQGALDVGLGGGDLQEGDDLAGGGQLVLPWPRPPRHGVRHSCRRLGGGPRRGAGRPPAPVRPDGLQCDRHPAGKVPRLQPGGLMPPAPDGERGHRLHHRVSGIQEPVRLGRVRHLHQSTGLG
ncbi:hypothetical protein K7B10_00220 [Streptomyces flavotricini]|uniref:Uncharacterized protein n=1 Tax=Streptomyces flavotricini TaxID=66888 RepID=A0ABS8DXB6_9ACTN|nr:hypothetical protein [Streptomyces flavotricini]MCC0093259.1 hypothetical protein [Streptomyces flavotricini]